MPDSSWSLLYGDYPASTEQDFLWTNSPDSDLGFNPRSPWDQFPYFGNFSITLASGDSVIEYPNIFLDGDDSILFSYEGEASVPDVIFYADNDNTNTDGTPPVAVMMPGQINRHSRTPWRLAQVQRHDNTARVHPVSYTHLRAHET